ncbi:MAG: T9SS type A sorting domain-containing protein [Muribaculaceae bacterium]|nr:T9SS type A sorting domain-containing protein [Muribaculaceae bacterium]
MKRLTSFILHNPNIRYSLRASMMYAIIILFALSPLDLKAAFSKHPTSIVQSITAKWYGTVGNIDRMPSCLNEPTESSYYYSGTLSTQTESYLTVTFKEGLTANDSEDLVFYMRRPMLTNVTNVDDAQPIEFDVMGRFNNSSGGISFMNKALFKVYLQYRGPFTDEYSIRIPIKKIFSENPSYKDYTFIGFRIVPTKNHKDGKYAARANGIRDMAINSFDILKIARDETYSDTFVDNFHLESDYGSAFEHYEFVNTQGIADSRNSISGWEMLNDSEIRRLQGMGITYPDYNFITPESDKKRNPYPLDNGQKRQPTHTVEHTIYAMPGDVIPLYPYYGLSHTKNFKENFSHWYEYKSGNIPNYTTPWSGEKVDLLDFLTDPSRIQKTSGNGFYGGQYMNVNPENIIQVSTPQEYAAAVTAINNGKYNAIIELTADLDFTGFDGNELVICPNWQHHFKGHINGKGHRISNFVVNKPDVETLGLLVTWTDSGVVIENIYIDNTCSITGKRNIGLVGFHTEKKLMVRNVRTEATVKAINGQAGGIVGTANNPKTSLVLKDCYIGGEIGMDGQSENAAIAGWWRVDEGDCDCTFSNITVNCDLHGTDGNANRKYIRSNSSPSPVVESGNGIKKRGYLSFKDCYGNLDKNDGTWNYIPSSLEFSAENLAKLGWTDYKTPPMSNTVNGVSSASFTKITDERDYIAKITAFNNGSKNNVNFELTQDLDFKDFGADEVPMIGDYSSGSEMEFAGVFNGAGHTIRNLKISRDEDKVGMFKATRQNARIENLIIDSSCVFEGKARVGLIGYHNWDPLVIRNVKTEATVRGSGANTGGIVGICDHTWGTNVLTLENVYIGGVVGYEDKGWDNGAISGWLSESNGNVTLTNVVVDCVVYKGDGSSGKKYIRHGGATVGSWTGNTYTVAVNSNWNFIYTNCFGNLDPTDDPWQTMNVITDESKLPVFDNWLDNKTPGIAENSELLYVLHGTGDRSVGTVATFFCPRDPFNKDSAQSLPMPAGADEYVIAADFSQTFNPQNNVDLESKQLIEPIIAFRHIFRIRDGKKFADMISGSTESNSNYLRTTRKYVSARTGAAFQVRLENPVPKPNEKDKSKVPPSHYYYVDENGEYRQVAKMGIKVLDGDTRKSTSKISFQFDNIYPGYGFREIDGIKYALGEGSYLSQDKHPDYDTGYDSTKESEYYLLLTNKSAMLQGHYLVQIVAQDYNGNTINIKGTSTPLVLMEYDINVLPKDGAWMVDMDELYSNENYRINSPEELDKKYVTQSVRIDFDEYMAINKLPDSDPLKSKLISWSTYNQTSSVSSNPGPDAVPTANGVNKTWFKWPRPWEQSTYIFGYNDRFDYSMYQLATHSENVVWKWAAKDFPESTDPASLKGNNPGDGSGLFDRRYYASKLDKTRSGEAEQGYFYYVNAASDPGVSASLRIDELCQGSRVFVSAWMAEFSTATEKGNLSFNFVAVLNDNVAEQYPNAGFVNGQRVVLHKFISGYPQNAGLWYNIYYSFTPRLAEFSSEGVTSDMVDHYELELDNNSRSSNGADYAIDDIRAYVVPPTVEAQQLSPACRDEKMRMLLGSPFETLLEVAGKRESLGDESENLDVYYTYLDKEKFDNLYYQEKKSMEEAFNASIITYNYNISDEDDRTFGKITFNGNYSKNTGYHEGEEEVVFGQAYSQTKESGQRMIVFESEISSGKLLANKHYYVIFKSSLGENDVPTIGQEAAFFNMADPCANTCVTYIKPPIITKLDGKIVADVENITICENQSPVIQVNLTGIDENNQSFDLEKNVYFDWFYGSKEELDEYTDGSDETHTLYRALTAFRLRHEEEVLLDTIQTDDNLIEGEKFEQWMLDLIKKASKPEGNSSIAKLALYKSSFVMPPARMGEDGKPYTHYVTVLPIACVPLGSYHGDPNILVCATPTPIPITVDARSPLLRHGLTGLTYPEDLTDVPLRIGIDQLKTNLTGGGNPASRRLDLPVRLTLSSDNKSKVLKLLKEPTHKFVNNEVSTVEQEGAVVLVQTNDPEYKDLGTLDKDSVEIGTLFWVGEIKKIVAKTNEEDTKQYVQLEFDNSFNFKEGYMYKFRFQYEESGEDTDESVCSGQDVFTIKVVPKYLAWTGANNLNWNDDSNWRRVGKTDLQVDDRRKNQLAHYVVDGQRGTPKIVNDNTMAYAPLDFTSVIVENGMEAPFMYPMSETKEVNDEYQPATVKYAWPSNPEKGIATLQDDDPGAEAVGKVTPLIHYDMAAFELNDNNRREDAEIGCRPWYANTCNEIHFKPGGTIMNQQELTYKKAWVDMELDHSRWYTVSSPLKEVYAGDFYLPSDGAREYRELYTDITFDNDLKINHRFKPAVFQRGWDKSVAKVYEIDGPAVDADNVRNVAVKTFWSHVYNDVKEQYGSGIGFSIKTDVSNMTKNKPNAESKVLFRLPKNDNNYLYFNKDGNKLGHSTDITRTENQYRLNDSNGKLVASSADNCEYFLVGNPFMTHMDIRKFLDKNEDILEQKYWVITESGQIAGGVDDSGNFIAADPTDAEWAEDPTVIAPMQGFFVKAKNSVEKIELEYDESMMRRYDGRSDHSGEYLDGTTRSESAGMLRIVAENYGNPSSAALLGVNDGSNWNVEAIDNRDIDIQAIVYTAGQGMALCINSVKDAEGTEIGVIADDDTETLIRFEGVDCIDGMYLLDKADHSLTPIEEGMEVAVEGAAAGRFFLSYGLADEGMMSGIEWSVSGGIFSAVDNASSGSLEVNVFDTLGRLVKHDATSDSVISVPLTPGIYVVEIRTAKENESIKIRI